MPEKNTEAVIVGAVVSVICDAPGTNTTVDKSSGASDIVIEV